MSGFVTTAAYETNARRLHREHARVVTPIVSSPNDHRMMTGRSVTWSPLVTTSKRTMRHLFFATSPSAFF